MLGQRFTEETNLDVDSASRELPIGLVNAYGDLAAGRLEAIQTAADGAGFDFFAPAPRDELEEIFARIHQRAESVTPLLHEILHHHPPSRRDQRTQVP